MRGAVGLVSLLQSEWMSPRELRHLQNRRLSRLLHHAYGAVPYYRKLFDCAGVRPEQVRNVSELSRIPISTRQEIHRQSIEDLTARGTELSKCSRSRTSGATGVPLEIVRRVSDRYFYNPSYLRAYMAWGFRPWHRLTQFQTRPERQSVSRSWYEFLGIFRHQTLPSLSEPSDWVTAIKAWKPYLIQGYCLTLKLLAEAIQRGNVNGIRVPLVSTTSGVLDPYGRKLLNSVFGARVVDVYAAEESGAVIAWECPKCSGYHINSDVVIVEFTKNGQPVEPGEDAEIVITNLTGYTMPFIRYALGDIGRMSTSAPACGRSLPLMESISGRSGDYILLTSGRKIVPHPFFIIMDETAGIGEWQLVQEDLHHLIVRLTMPYGKDPKRIQQIQEELKKLVGESVGIQIEVVEQLRKNRSEKLRSVISRVELP